MYGRERYKFENSDKLKKKHISIHYINSNNFFNKNKSILCKSYFYRGWFYTTLSK